MNRIALGDMLRRSASSFKDKPAIMDGQITLSYRELNEKCNRFAHYLLDKGFKKGDAIATVATNSIWHVIAMYGIQKAGLVWVPINPGIGASEKQYIMEAAGIQLVIVDDMLREMDAAIYTNQKIILISAESTENTLQNIVEEGSTEEPDVHIEDRDISQIMFTSGTTGNPKGVCISHLAVHMAGLGNIIDFNIQEDEVLLAVMPMFHCAQHSFIHSFLTRGTTIVAINGFDPENFMAMIEKQQATFLFLLPMMYRAIIHHPNRKNYDLTSLRTCLYAMAPMDRTTLETGIRELNVDFVLGTGQTEMYPATMLFKPEEQLKRFGSYWGVSGIINETAIMDDAGNILPDGQVGEIVHRGPNVMSYYLNNEEETKFAKQYDWHHTGDLGYWDEDGQMVFVDRKKDMIKTGGENVASIKIEQILLNHPKVENAIVIGLPHERWIEAVTAFVQPKDNVSEEDVIGYCKEHLGGFQVPKKIVFVEQFPMTSTGKIQKHKLRIDYKTLYEENPEYS